MQIVNPIKNEDIIACAKEAAIRAGYQNPRNPNVQTSELGPGEAYATDWYVTMEAQKQTRYITIKINVQAIQGSSLMAETIINEIS